LSLPAPKAGFRQRAKASVKSFCPSRVPSYGHLRNSAKILANHAHKNAELFRICDAQVIAPTLHFILTRNTTTPGKHLFCWLQNFFFSPKNGLSSAFYSLFCSATQCM
jgi:hypothetical protein